MDINLPNNNYYFMSVEDNDNIYVIEEEENQEELDDSPINYAAYERDGENEEEEEREAEIKNASAFGLLFKIMFNPVEGWKKLRRSGLNAEQLQSGCFYPLLAVLAVCNFADYFYSVNVSLSQVITQAVVAFVSFFFGYFCVLMVLSWVLPKETSLQFHQKFGKEYTIISLSTLALFSIFTELLPMLWPILIFLPIWTLYIMFKGVRFFKIQPNKEMKFYVVCAIATIGAPLAIDWVLNSILPY